MSSNRLGHHGVVMKLLGSVVFDSTYLTFECFVTIRRIASCIRTYLRTGTKRHSASTMNIASLRDFKDGLAGVLSGSYPAKFDNKPRLCTTESKTRTAIRKGSRL
jgi:hypothetical protein